MQSRLKDLPVIYAQGTHQPCVPNWFDIGDLPEFSPPFWWQKRPRADVAGPRAFVLTNSTHPLVTRAVHPVLPLVSSSMYLDPRDLTASGQ